MCIILCGAREKAKTFFRGVKENFIEIANMVERVPSQGNLNNGENNWLMEE